MFRRYIVLDVRDEAIKITAARAISTYVYGGLDVTLKKGDKQQEQDPRISNAYVHKPDDIPTGRFDIAFTRHDAKINLQDGTSDYEDTLDEAAQSTEGDIIFDRDIDDTGLNGWRPGVDFEVGDIVNIRVWGVLIPQVVTSISRLDGSDGINWKVHVGGQLINDKKELENKNKSILKTIADERAEYGVELKETRDIAATASATAGEAKQQSGEAKQQAGEAKQEAKTATSTANTATKTANAADAKSNEAKEEARKATEAAQRAEKISQQAKQAQLEFALSTNLLRDVTYPGSSSITGRFASSMDPEGLFWGFNATTFYGSRVFSVKESPFFDVDTNSGYKLSAWTRFDMESTDYGTYIFEFVTESGESATSAPVRLTENGEDFVPFVKFNFTPLVERARLKSIRKEGSNEFTMPVGEGQFSLVKDYPIYDEVDRVQNLSILANRNAIAANRRAIELNSKIAENHSKAIALINSIISRQIVCFKNKKTEDNYVSIQTPRDRGTIEITAKGTWTGEIILDYYWGDGKLDMAQYDVTASDRTFTKSVGAVFQDFDAAKVTYQVRVPGDEITETDIN